MLADGTWMLPSAACAREGHLVREGAIGLGGGGGEYRAYAKTGRSGPDSQGGEHLTSVQGPVALDLQSQRRACASRKGRARDKNPAHAPRERQTLRCRKPLRSPPADTGTCVATKVFKTRGAGASFGGQRVLVAGASGQGEFFTAVADFDAQR